MLRPKSHPDSKGDATVDLFEELELSTQLQVDIATIRYIHGCRSVLEELEG